ncbi:hypothetical protein AOQ84DRAFT_386467 [Glonium stellatum]|uniref:Uncharacterized protein n=1 Tax=Glonium stellatum TaxID=574774 RepID=A0A8E2F7F1_9PEZI|nr:hypothetical protein AOQ84DRAFT_386467 [Glonium stellatum]
MHLRTTLLFLISASSLATASLFSDIFRSIIRTNRFSNLVQEIPQDIIDNLENDEQLAGEAICDMLGGNIPAFLGDVVNDLSSEAESEFNSLLGFVEGLPKLAPAILGDIEQDAEDVVSVIGELVTNPGAAVTVIVDGIESVVDDIWGEIKTVGGEIITDIECFFGDCPTAAVSTPAEVLALQSSCSSISAAASTALVSITYAAASTTVNAAPSTSNYAMPSMTTATAAPTTVIIAAATSQVTVAPSPTTFLESAITGQSRAAAASAAPQPTPNNGYKGWRVDLVWMAAALLGTGLVMRAF